MPNMTNMTKTKDAPWSMNALCVCSLVQNHVPLMLIGYVIDHTL